MQVSCNQSGEKKLSVTNRERQNFDKAVVFLDFLSANGFCSESAETLSSAIQEVQEFLEKQGGEESSEDAEEAEPETGKEAAPSDSEREAVAATAATDKALLGDACPEFEE